MTEVKVKLKEVIAQHVTARVEQENLDQSQIVADLLQSGFEQKLQSWYQAYQEGEITLGYLAEKLGMTTWQLYHFLEERGWCTANI